MSYNFDWPEIPFTGAEVTAFVNAYKGLAESIYENWFDEVGYDSEYHTSYLENPFTNREVIKELLTYGLIYASFIIKQRSGGGGPGTNFDLSASPYRPQLSDAEKTYVIGNLGCVFTPEAMKSAWQRKTGGTAPPRLSDAVEDLLDDLFNNGPTDPETQPPQDCNLTAREAIYDGLVPLLPFTTFLRSKAALLKRYLTCDNSVFTEDDLPAGQANSIRDALQDFSDHAPDQYKTPLNLTTEQKAQYGAGPTNTVWRYDFYNPPGESRNLRTLFGVAVVIKNSSGQVIGVRDDFDFVYGKELNRTDGSVAGTPYQSSDVGNGLYYKDHWLDLDKQPVPVGTPGATPSNGPGNPQDIRDKNTNPIAGDEVGRWTVATAYENGRGTPVPISINFTNP